MAVSIKRFESKGALSPQAARELLALIVAYETVTRTASGLPEHAVRQRMELTIRQALAEAGVGLSVGDKADVTADITETVAELGRMANDARRKELPRSDPNHALISSAIGGALVALGWLEQAEAILRPSFDLVKREFGSDDTRFVEVCNRMANLYSAMDKREKAEFYRGLLSSVGTIA